MGVHPTPICQIAFNPATDCYAFAFHFPGRPVHHCIDTFDSLQAALRWADAHRERIWEEPSDADEDAMFVSRAYVPGSMYMAHA